MMPARNPVAAMINMIKANPAIADNPQAQSYLDVLESGDARKGEEVANNLLETYGMTKEEALAQAKRFFRIPM